MIQRLAVVLALNLVFFGSPVLGAKFQYRWFMVRKNLDLDRDVEEIGKLVETAAAHGYNGMMLDARLDWWDVRKPDFFPRLEKVKQICDEHKVEIIPVVCTAASIAVHDRNLLEGFPVKNAAFLVQGQEARPQTDPTVRIPNGGLEESNGHRLANFKFQDQPGKVTFVDTEVVKEGKASLRLEDFGSDPRGHARLMFELQVRPNRVYRVRLAAKAEHLAPAKVFRYAVLDGKAILGQGYFNATDEWKDFDLVFNSRQHEKVSIYLGVWKGKQGRIWLDDLRIDEPGLLRIVRRDGCPLVVRDAKSDTVYEEGRDFAAVSNPKNDAMREALPLRLLPGSRLVDGQSLRVSFYHRLSIENRTSEPCLSEPKVYEIWESQIKLIQQHLSPRNYFLTMDEFRQGFTCETCRNRHMSAAQMLGDCVTKQFQMIRAINPDAEVFVWHDMFDPYANAHDDYYLVEGDLTGSWKYIPKDLVIVNWGGQPREESLRHFAKLGFRTMGSAYYDAADLEGTKAWLAALNKTPRVVGIMYTSWQDKFELLGPFGDLVVKGHIPASKPRRRR